MTTKYPCYIEFTNLGHFARLVHKSGFVIAELLINDTNFSLKALAAYDYLGMKSGIPDNFRNARMPYRAEVNEIQSIDVIVEEIEILKNIIDESEKLQEELEIQMKGDK